MEGEWDPDDIGFFNPDIPRPPDRTQVTALFIAFARHRLPVSMEGIEINPYTLCKNLMS